MALHLDVDAVLLDIDDTLLDTTGAMLGAGGAAMAALWPHRDERFHRDAALRFRVDPGDYFRRYTAGELTFEQMRRARLDEVAAHYGEALDESSARVYESVYRPAFNAAQQMYDDVRPFIERARGGGVRVGALTNAGDRVTRDKLDALGAAELFDALVTRDTLGVGKPAKRVFLLACERLGAPPERTAYIGDELEADALGAVNAGLVAVWLRRAGRAGYVPDGQLADADAPSEVHVIRNLTALDLG